MKFPTGAFGTPIATGPIPGHNVVVDQGSLTTYTSGTGLEQPITQMFKIHASNLAATADINTARIQLDQAQDEVALKARQLYYGLLIAQLKQEAATEELSASRVKAQESTDSVERGQALEVVALESNAAGTRGPADGSRTKAADPRPDAHTQRPPWSAAEHPLATR